VGLGRSIFGLLDRNALTYGLAHVEKRSRTATAFAPPIATSFITTATNGALLRAQMTPLPATAGERRGFVLLLHDMTQRVAADSRRDLLLQGLTERMRGGLGNMRAALELLEQFPTMPPTQRQRFQRVLDEEAAALSRELDQVARDFAADLRGQWHFEAISGNDLLWAVEHQLAAQEGVQIQTGFGTETGIAPLWVRIDSYAVVHGLATAVRLLRDEFQRTAFTVRLQPFYPLVAQASAPPDPARQCRFAALDVYWSSQGIATAAWLAWQERFTTADAGDTTLTLRTVAAQHGSEVWFQHEQATAQSYFRLLLPLAAMPPTFPQPATVAPVIESRPQYYDFDLFGQTTQNSPLHEQTLDQLTYTVFDTETTGLDPQRDEIVAIGAVRVLNGRLLRQEIFDQLVDPQRPIPRLATEIHGIADSMVQGQPLIAAVLPRFARFAEETVLVGHNLAFDLRMFEVKADVAGVHFAQPRLDTLLLSEIIRPDAEDHALEAIAARLGINVLGRHTALGDAFVTAEIFLRLLPLLNAQGIFTLADALTASKATYLARLQY
jgi:DNA polymerase-3 subunit epsilon